VRAAVAAAVREITTPEGVVLRFEVATAFERYAACVFDLLLIGLGTALLALPVILAGGLEGGWSAALFILAAFLLRHGYFIWFEVRRQGATPGKRRIGIRVIDRCGGSLAAEAVFARNLTREVEIFVPLALLADPRVLLPEAPLGAALLGSAWLLLLAALPLFNRDRLRAGDLIAGTMVVRAPTSVLLDDLSAAPPGRPRARHSFTPAMLGVYGIYELQVLEEVLRTPAPDREGLEVIARKIRDRIGWKDDGRPPPARPFLEDFYAAQRAHLEGRLLLGDRKERKEPRERVRGRSTRGGGPGGT
jgi:uncharacterized RDD family membrane protein YckC